MDALRQTSGGPVIGALADAVGQTPVLRLARCGHGLSAPFLAKLELRSPTGSGKDRVALAVLEALASAGRLAPGQALVVPSTGNLAVSLAWAAATRGHAVHAVIPRASSLEFRQLLKLYRAELELTASEDGVSGARVRARELAQQIGACLFDPFSDALAVAGARGLVQEIAALQAQLGDALGGVVCGLGSGATAAALRQFLPEVPVTAVEPAESAVHSGGVRGPHKVHGIGMGFRSEHLRGVEGIRFVQIPAAEAWNAKRQLAATEGLFVGPTTGAVLAAARIEAASARGPLVCLAMDSGERYFSQEALVP